MFRIIFFLVMLTCHNMLALAGDAAPARTALDKIVAVVNDDVITRTELDTRLRAIKEQLRGQRATLPPDAVLEKQVLDRMITATLQLQLADRNGIRVDDETLNRTISRIAEENKLSLSEFRTTLEREGYDFASFREDIRREIIINRIQQRQINERIMISDQEIDVFLSAQRAQDNSEEEYHLAHILIAVPDAASSERIQAARAKAEDILARLRNGANFQETAIASSEGQQALQGGDLGWRKLAELPTLFVEPASQMKPGDISGLIRSASGFHIIKLLEQRSNEQHVVTQIRARHILIRLDALTDDATAQKRLRELRKRLEQGADFASLARENSGDTATASNGGELGWINPGDLVPRFEEELAKLDTGQLSQPFKTGMGWHLAQLMERRQYDNTAAYIRNQARETLRQRKAEEELQTWLSRLRDEAYIENLLTQ